MNCETNKYGGQPSTTDLDTEGVSHGFYDTDLRYLTGLYNCSL